MRSRTAMFPVLAVLVGTGNKNVSNNYSSFDIIKQLMKCDPCPLLPFFRFFFKCKYLIKPFKYICMHACIHTDIFWFLGVPPFRPLLPYLH